MAKHIIRIGIVILTPLLALVVLWQFRVIIAYISISAMLAAALRPGESPVGRKLIGMNSVDHVDALVLVLRHSIFLTGKVAIAEVHIFGAGLSKQDAWTLPTWLEGTTFNTHWFCGCDLQTSYWQ